MFVFKQLMYVFYNVAICDAYEKECLINWLYYHLIQALKKLIEKKNSNKSPAIWCISILFLRKQERTEKRGGNYYIMEYV